MIKINTVLEKYLICVKKFYFNFIVLQVVFFVQFFRWGKASPASLDRTSLAFTQKKYIISWNLARWLRTMSWDTITKSPCFGCGTSPFSAFKVCHLVSKSFYHPTANPKVVKEPSCVQKLVFKCRLKKITLKLMTSLLVRSLPKFLKKWRIDGSNCKWELGFWFQTKNCSNQSDDVTGVFDDVICHEF